ncbi:MAG: hypothetical protein BZ138_01470 [Methanosphaera sp. rholeuAM270]|jgi:HSP20 family protein|nr:MAG: hypothetical protein BZ138_01470 [Methanosphaera sp. rholeuAM270]
MNNVYVDSKDDKEEDINLNNETEEETTTTFEEDVDEKEEDVDETEKEFEDTEENSEEKDCFDYKEYGKETVEETKNIAEKMFNDVVTTLKSRQSEWNKTFEEYKANKPPVDLFEFEDKLVLKLDAPRASKDDISIKMCTDSIEIEIDFPDCIDDDEKVQILRKERCSGKTKSIIPLPVEVDIKEVKASFKDNELTISLPKIRGKKVDVEIV